MLERALVDLSGRQQMDVFNQLVSNGPVDGRFIVALGAVVLIFLIVERFGR